MMSTAIQWPSSMAVQIKARCHILVVFRHGSHNVFLVIISKHIKPIFGQLQTLDLILTFVGLSHLAATLGYGQYGLIILISLTGKTLAKELKRYLLSALNTPSFEHKAIIICLYVHSELLS
jgi:hypothetical protein